MDLGRVRFDLCTSRARCITLSDKYETVTQENSMVSMIPQLGTSPKIQDQQEWDMRLLSYIVSPEKIPESFKPILYALVRRDVVLRKKRFWDSLADNYLVLVNSIDGRGRNDQIRGENALKGLSVPIEAPPEKPGILDRIMDRDNVREYELWKERREAGLE